MATAKERMLKEINDLLTEGQQVLGSSRAQTHLGEFTIANPTSYVDTVAHAKWLGGCRNILRLLGKLAESWKLPFEEHGSRTGMAKRQFGTLQAIKQAVERDLLVTVEDLVMADAFADLLEQADHLFSEGYLVAAGVLGRAVLEEHLRNLCGHAGLVPQKPKPTLNDFKQELQKAGKLNKIEVTHVDSMAAVGNEAAHNKPTLTKEAVERLIRDVRDFLVRHPAA